MSDDILTRLVDFDHCGNTATERLALRTDAWAEIRRLRAMLREVIDGAWEMELEDRHTIDSDIIGKVAAYFLARQTAAS